MFDWTFVLGFLQITLIDLVLSGDNAIVIGMAASCLPKQQRKMAIVAGGALAIGLRVGLTVIATLLMGIPLLSAVGGVVLIWVVYKLLKIEVCEEGSEKVKSASNFKQAILLIVVSDFMMSLDNVIAVAGTAQGHIVLLIAGLLLSMPLLMTTGGAISMLIDKMKWLVYVGAVAISFTGARMVFEDKFIEAQFPETNLVIYGVSALCGVLIPLFFVWFNRRGKPTVGTA